MRAFLFLHAIRLITSFLYSSTACVLIYSVLALFCVHSSYDPALPLCASLLYSSTDCVQSHSCPALLLAYSFITLHIFSVRIPTVFQHCRREVLLHCSTLCMHFYHVPVLSAYISIVLQFPCISLGFLDWEYLTFWEAFWTALGCFWGAQLSGVLSDCYWAGLFACISTVYQHCLHAFLFCMLFG